jgi:hypothetical protein
VISGRSNNVAPAAVQNLAATVLGTSSIRVSFMCTGDDELSGTPASYELRYAPWPITSANFPLATVVPTTVSGPAGTTETFTVSGLEAGTTYRFAVVVKDEVGNESYLSNVAVAETDADPDTTPPGTVSNLTVRLPAAGGLPLAVAADSASSAQEPAFGVVNVADGNVDTAWASAVRSANQVEWIRIALAELTDSARVEVHPHTGFSALFPPDFEVRVSPDGLAWNTIASESGVGAGEGPFAYSFYDSPTKFVEFRATSLAPSGDFFYAVLGEIEVTTAEPAPGTVLVEWTAPADDGPSRQAAGYDLRVGPCPYAHTSSDPLPTWAPLDPGAPERYTFDGLAGTVCFGLTAIDEAGNESAVSNVASIDL